LTEIHNPNRCFAHACSFLLASTIILALRVNG
jgi:hypothetical protein